MRLGMSLCALFIGFASACSARGPKEQMPAETQIPTLQRLSRPALRVGDRLQIQCDGCVDSADGFVEVELNGNYASSTGGSEAANFKVALRTDENGFLDWREFGAYRIPFGECAQGGNCSTGTFTGTICATNRYNDGRTGAGTPANCLETSLEVLPSIVVRDFYPFDPDGEWVAECKYPALNAIAGGNYRLEVEAVGFNPSEYQYSISGGLVIKGQMQEDSYQLSYRRTEADAGSTRTALLLQVGAVPPFSNGYRMSVTVRGVGDVQNAEPVTLTYDFMVRRALAAFMRPNGFKQLVEIYEPESRDGCYSGNVSNNNAAFSTEIAITETATVSENFSQNWARTVSESNQQSFGRTEAQNRTDTSSGTVTTTDARNRSNNIGATASRGVSRSATKAFSFADSNTSVVGASGSNSGSVSRAANAALNDGGLAGAELDAGIGFPGIPAVGNNGQTDTSVPQRSSVDTGASGNLAIQSVDGDASSRGLDGSVSRDFKDESEFGSDESDSFGNSGNASRGSSVGSTWGRTNTLSAANSTSLARGLSQSETVSDALTRARSHVSSEARQIIETFAVSKSTREGTTISHPIFAGNFATRFVQKFRYVTSFDVVAFDLCGNGTVVGESKITSWEYAQEIAQDDQCPPRSCLIAAQCVDSDNCEGSYPPPERQVRHPECPQARQAYGGDGAVTEFSVAGDSQSSLEQQ